MGIQDLIQYLENLEAEMAKRGATSLAELAKNKMAHLATAAADSLTNKRYKKSYHPYDLPKVSSS